MNIYIYVMCTIIMRVHVVDEENLSIFIPTGVLFPRGFIRAGVCVYTIFYEIIYFIMLKSVKSARCLCACTIRGKNSPRDAKRTAAPRRWRYSGRERERESVTV